MISSLRTDSLRELLLMRLPPFAVSLGVADTFFKFGSFALECVAFLALWWVLDYAYRGLLPGRPADSQEQ